MDGVIAVHLLQSRVKPGEQMHVRCAVFIESGEAFMLQELFFALKVHLGEFDQTLELNADVAAIATVDEQDAQLIQGVHQDPMLVVHGLNTNDALVTPRQQGHQILHNQGQV